ncbi:MAG: PIN domain-containing protein [Gammaproteobacteria bacterium]|nr:PIN domain-containing protein [Gammaproteobacteria bacterium]
MGVTTLPTGSRLYLDANVWIYALEGYAAFAAPLAALFARIDAGELNAITSEFTLAEVLVKPFADLNVALQQRYIETLKDRPSLRIVPVTREILISAARLRAQHPTLKMPDALHAATALESGAGVLVSNDTRFVAVPGLQLMKLSD